MERRLDFGVRAVSKAVLYKGVAEDWSDGTEDESLVTLRLE